VTGNQTTRTSKTLSRRRKYENKIQVITSFCRETWLGYSMSEFGRWMWWGSIGFISH